MATNLCNDKPIPRKGLLAPVFATDDKAIAWAQDNPGRVCRSTESGDFFEVNDYDGIHEGNEHNA